MNLVRLRPRSLLFLLGLVALPAAGCDCAGGSTPDGGPPPRDAGPRADAPYIRPDAAVGPGEVDEFAGPFECWINVRTDAEYGGAVGDGTTDDTAALQRAIDHLSDDGWCRVLYLPAGTYVIRETLRLQGVNQVRIIGEDPATTTLLWEGTVGGDMLWIDAVNDSEIQRIAFDGASVASMGIRQEVSQMFGNYSGQNRYLDLELRNLEWGIRSPASLSCGQADAENVVERCVFSNISRAGVEISSSNAFNWFVWYSRFEDCAIGVNNGPVTAEGPCNGNAYGEIFVYESTFLRSTNSDVVGVKAARGNLSIDSNAFQAHDPFVSRPIRDQQSFFFNTILDPVQSVAIDITSPIGTAIDNVIRSREGATGPVIRGQAHLITVGNRLTVADGIEASGRVTDVDNEVVGRDAIADVMAPYPAVARRRDRMVFEHGGGSMFSHEEIQAAIDEAVAYEAANPGSRPIVHVRGAILGDTVVIPAGTDIEIVGDGRGTWLNYQGEESRPAFRIEGPTRVRMTQFTIWGQRPGGGDPNASSLVEIVGADQPGSRAVLSSCYLLGPRDDRDQLGLLVEGMSHLDVSAMAYFSGPVRVVGGSEPGDARVALFGAANISGYRNGPGVPAFEVRDGGALLVEDHYSESFRDSSGTLNMRWFRASGAGARPGHASLSITTNAGDVPLDIDSTQYDVENFPGTITFLAGTYWMGRLGVRAEAGLARETSILALGGQFPDPVDGSYPDDARILMTNRGAIDSGWSVDHPDVAVNVDDTDAYIRGALAFRRAQRPPASPLAPTASGTTDIRLERLVLFYGSTAEIYIH